MPTWLRTKTRKGNLSPKRRWNHFRSLASLCHGSQLVAWQITHATKQRQTTVFYTISTFIPPLRCTFSCRVCYLPRFSRHSATSQVCCGLLPWTAAGCARTYIHSRAFSVSCCSVLWFLNYIDRMQRRRALVALHKGAQECCRHGSRHRSCKSFAARSYLSLRMPMPTALMPLADAITSDD